MNKNKLYLPPKYQRELKALFKKYLPRGEVWAYGSRINGKAHKGSDLDLALRSSSLKPISSSKMGALREALTESNIPFIVEARDWAALPKNFHEEIEKNHIVLFSGKK